MAWISRRWRRLFQGRSAPRIVRRRRRAGRGLGPRFLHRWNGTLWAPTEGGLSRIKDGHILTLTSQNGLPCNTVHWMMEDDTHSVWLYLACGLVRIGRSELDAWASHPKQTIQATVFDSSDGVSSHRFSGGYNSVVAKSADGKLWFVRPGGVSIIDPRHLAFNTLPPPVHIEQITADGRPTRRRTGLRLPPLIRDLAIDYTALSLVAPEKVRFRIKLEGRDQHWHDVVTIGDRCCTPTSVRALTASASSRATTAASGTKTGAALDFSIAPAYYQTRWFEARVVAGVFALAVGGPIAPRSVKSLGEFNDGWTRASASARASRGNCTTRCCKASTVCCCDSRPPCTCCQIARQTPKSNSLVRLITRRRRSRKGATPFRACGRRPSKGTISRSRSARWETTRDRRERDQPPIFSVAVEGRTRDLHPIVRDEIYKIAAEALRNAFRHAHAGRSRSRSATTTSNSDCACATMARGSIRRCSQTRVSRDTTVCAA